MVREQIQFSAGMPVRSDFRAGQAQVVCYQYINGAWYPVGTPLPTYPVVTPTPPDSNAQWLTCQSCKGSTVGAGQLQNAVCELCML